MGKYLAKAVFQIVTPEGCERGQFEEVLTLVNAENSKKALHKALDWGQKGSSEFVNRKGVRIIWKFVAISELRLLPELEDGIELDSHIEHVGVEEEFIRLQRDKQGGIIRSIEHTVDVNGPTLIQSGNQQ